MSRNGTYFTFDSFILAGICQLRKLFSPSVALDPLSQYIRLVYTETRRYQPRRIIWDRHNLKHLFQDHSERGITKEEVEVGGLRVTPIGADLSNRSASQLEIFGF